MEPTSISEEKPVADIVQETAEIVEQVSEYGFLIVNSLYLIIIGMFAIFIIHKLVSKFLYPYLENRRLIKVIFGTMYVLILVIIVLIALKENGYDVRVIGQLALLSVLIGAVVIFFLVPFFPRLPFKLGHMVEINSVIGTVDAISSFHTTIRKFDGTMVFIPNALVMASRIMNYHDTPSRRIELKLLVNTESNMDEARALFLKLMNEDERVLDEPSPPIVFVMDANATGVEMTAYCWVNNEDWLSARSDLWLNVVNAFIKDDRVSMSRPQQQIYLVKGNDTSSQQN